MQSISNFNIICFANTCIKKGTDEQSLLRIIFDCIVDGDIVMGDAYFPNFFLMADIIRKKADGIFQGQSQRRYDFRKGDRLGKNDHIVEWKKPKRPEWMDPETYACIPDKIRIREFKVAGKIITMYRKRRSIMPKNSHTQATVAYHCYWSGIYIAHRHRHTR